MWSQEMRDEIEFIILSSFDDQQWGPAEEGSADNPIRLTPTDLPDSPPPHHTHFNTLPGQELTTPPPAIPSASSTCTTNNSSLPPPPPAPPTRSNIDLIGTLEKAECSFCSVDLNPGDGVMLQSCLHNFCMNCIHGLISQSDSAQIACPSQGCQGILYDLEVKALLSPDGYQSYLNRSLRKAETDLEDMSRCQNPNCSKLFSIPKEALSFKCLVCEQVTCNQCKRLRDDEACQCHNRGMTVSEGNYGQTGKRRKIDPELKNDWESNWSRVSLSVSTSPRPSTSLGAGSSQLSGNGSLQDVLKKMDKNDLLRSTQEFTCAICFMDIPPGEGIILKECFHMFCGDCLTGTIVHCEENNVKCPFQVNDYICPCFVSDREIKAILSPESHEKFLRRSVTQAELSMGNSFHCKTVNCTAWCEFEEGAQIFHCPVCLKQNCLKCRGIHESITCQEYKARLDEANMDVETKQAFAIMIQNGTAMKCPTCKIMIQKTVGCDGMTCSVCKTPICWATKGPRWGPKGKGDRTGGCHCGERGKKCHPKCGFCH